MAKNNIQVKASPEFYDEFKEIADFYNVSMSALGAFVLSHFIDIHKTSSDNVRQLFIESVSKKSTKSIDEK